MTRTVTATFETSEKLAKALIKLKAIGVTEAQIGVVMSNETHGRSFNLETHNRVDEGLAAGATFGGIIGGILSALAGAGTLTIPGLNLVVTGAVVSGLAGAGIGAGAGGLVGGLVGLGVPEHEAKLYEVKLNDGHILLAVEVHDHWHAAEVHNVLKNMEAYNIAA